MANLPIAELEPWIANRILYFLNKAKTPEDLTGDGLSNAADVEDVDNFPFYSIGRLTAERILQRRQATRFNRFEQLDVLNEIAGFGPDKFNDLVEVFQVPAAAAFRKAMYDKGIIFASNFKLTHHTEYLKDRETYQQVAKNPSNLRQFVMDMVQEAVQSLSGDQLKGRMAAGLLANSHVDVYTNSFEEASLALALWFYRASAGDWFTFNQVLAETEGYFSHHPFRDWSMELHFFRGYQHYGLSDGIVTTGLPVVLSDAERSVTVWTFALYD